MKGQDHVARLQRLTEDLQVGWESFAKTKLHIMPMPDPMETTCGESGLIEKLQDRCEVPAISVEHLIVFPCVVQIPRLLPQASWPEVWGWRIMTFYLPPGGDIAPDQVEYTEVGDFVNDAGAMGTIVAEVAGAYMVDAIRAHREHEGT